MHHTLAEPVPQRVAGRLPGWHRGGMKILSYSGESVLTSDRIGDAVIDYARALASQNAADVVDIPVFDPDTAGPATLGMARLLIGPSSQLIVIPARDIDYEVQDAGEVEIIRQKIEALAPSRVTASDETSWWDEELGFDLL